MRRPVLLCLLALLAVLAGASSAHASAGQGITFDASSSLTDPNRRDRAFADLESLGVKRLRVLLQWREVAPAPNARRKPRFAATDPNAYRWGKYDPVMAGAQERGWPVLLTVTSPVPRWATPGGRDRRGVTRPSAREFQAFMTALGRRYGGQVRQWAIWNEPNQPQFLLPQYRRTRGGRTPVSPRIYRGLFLAGWRGLRASGNGRDTILFGETSPRGTGSVVSPLAFLRGTLCLDRAYRRRGGCPNLPADGYAHHAYSTRLGPFFRPPQPNDVTIGVLGRLSRALDRAGRTGAIRRGMGIWITEFGVQTSPDRILGVPTARQAEFFALSERIAYRNPRVRLFNQYLLRDDPTIGGFQSGLITYGGRRKPGFDGFRLTLAAARGRTAVSLWGVVRPATGPTTAEVQVADRGRGFRTLQRVRTNARGVLQLRTAPRAGRRWRLRWTSPQGRRFTGAPVRAYTSSGRVG